MSALFFFFSSRRRHTRCGRDWSSDVCSSDLVVPGLLQTAEYARARFAQGVRLHKVPDDVDEAVRLRVQRQEILYRPDKRFHFVLTEAALRNRLCPVDVMLAQLDRLVALSALRNVRLGIIPFAT